MKKETLITEHNFLKRILFSILMQYLVNITKHNQLFGNNH